MSQNKHTSANESKIKNTHAYESKPSILMFMSQNQAYSCLWIKTKHTHVYVPESRILMLMNQNQAYSCLYPRIKHTHAYDSKPSILMLVSQKRYPLTTHHLTFNALLNPFQSTYTKYYSTETTLLVLNVHLTNAISHQQVSCLCLLELSAAFDTLDHSILIHRLSTWFGISELPLQSFTSYISFLTSAVSIPPHLSSFEPLTCGVPQGSVLGTVLFNLYTIPLSTFISLSSILHLHADDTQLSSISFPKTFLLLPLTYIPIYLSYLLGCHLTTSPLLNPLTAK